MKEENRTDEQTKQKGGADDDHHMLTQVELAQMLGVSVTTIQRMRKDPGFPKRKRFAYSQRGWIKGEVKQWLVTCPAA